MEITENQQLAQTHKKCFSKPRFVESSLNPTGAQRLECSAATIDEGSAPDYLSGFQEISPDPEFTRIFQGSKSLVVAFCFYSDEPTIGTVEYYF